jgi:hypothetical protein
MMKESAVVAVVVAVAAADGDDDEGSLVSLTVFHQVVVHWLMMLPVALTTMFAFKKYVVR